MRFSCCFLQVILVRLAHLLHLVHLAHLILLPHPMKRKTKLSGFTSLPSQKHLQVENLLLHQSLSTNPPIYLFGCMFLLL